MKIAVTGATGFLGSNLCRQASRAGHEIVSALGTNVDAGGKLASEGFSFVPARLSQVETMATAFQGADAVVHCAAKSAPWGSRRSFEDTNVVGTANVVKACRRAGVPRLVHISSASVYFRLEDRYDIRESSPLPEPVNEYARSKAMSEVAAFRFERDVVVLRPRGIFGPGDTTLVPRLARVGRGGHLPLLRGGRAQVDITFVDVVSSAILAAAAAPCPVRGTYNVAHGESVRVKDLVERIMAALGLPVAWRRVPLVAALAAATMAESVSRIMNSKDEPPLTAYSLGLLAFSQTLDISAIKADLGWTPPVSLEMGLGRTTEWLERSR